MTAFAQLSLYKSWQHFILQPLFHSVSFSSFQRKKYVKNGWRLRWSDYRVSLSGWFHNWFRCHHALLVDLLHLLLPPESQQPPKSPKNSAAAAASPTASSRCRDVRRLYCRPPSNWHSFKNWWCHGARISFSYFFDNGIRRSVRSPALLCKWGRPTTSLFNNWCSRWNNDRGKPLKITWFFL